MTRLPRSLAREARECCSNRGHRMGPWKPGSDWYAHIRKSECSACGMTVYVNPRPQPNDVEIGGDAVASDCNRED